MASPTNHVVYTQEEQLDLQRLEQNLELFNALKALLTQGTFPGNASVALVRCQQFADNLLVNTSKQFEDIKKAATERSTKPEAATKE